MRQSRYNVVIERGDRVWVYNGVSGMQRSLSKIEWDRVADFLDGDEKRPPSRETLHDLALGRMVVNDDLDEVALLERRYRRGTTDRSSFALTVVTSLGCNFDCPYCYQVKPTAILDAETQALLLDVLDAQLPTLDHFHVTWFGGEPLLAKGVIYQLSEAFLDRTRRAGRPTRPTSSPTAIC